MPTSPTSRRSVRRRCRRHRPKRAAPSASSGFELLKPGEAVPDASFVDQDGKKRTFSSFKGSPVLMTFIYTKCPMPTFCPLMDQHFATIQKKLKDDPALKGRVHLVSVSFDPIVDTPPVLKAHAQTLGADLKTWTFLTGDRDDIDRFAARFGVSVARSLTDQRDITHNLRTALVDAGRQAGQGVHRQRVDAGPGARRRQARCRRELIGDPPEGGQGRSSDGASTSGTLAA